MFGGLRLRKADTFLVKQILVKVRVSWIKINFALLHKTLELTSSSIRYSRYVYAQIILGVRCHSLWCNSQWHRSYSQVTIDPRSAREIPSSDASGPYFARGKDDHDGVRSMIALWKKTLRRCASQSSGKQQIDANRSCGGRQPCSGLETVKRHGPGAVAISLQLQGSIAQDRLRCMIRRTSAVNSD